MHIQKRKISVVRRGLKAIVPALVVTGLALVGMATARALAPGDMVTYTPVPFVTSQWVGDRTYPTGGVSVGPFDGRTGVLTMNIDGSKMASDPWYRYEGLQRNIEGSTAVKADLYVDSSWPSSVNAGMWGVGVDKDSAISAYPIIAFVKDGSYTGWRTFNDETGAWVDMTAVPYHTGWNTVELTFNSLNTTFDFTVNGKSAGSSAATGSVGLSAVILNNKNFSTSYAVHWSNLATGVVMKAPMSKSQCMNNSWRSYGFKNQGECVSYVNHHNGVGQDDVNAGKKN